jgi:hypothetical protein
VVSFDLLWKKYKLLKPIQLLNYLVYSLVVSFAVGWSLELFAKIYLLISLNLFAFPLLFVFSGFPSWVYYFLFLFWGSDLLFYMEVEKAFENRKGGGEA